MHVLLLMINLDCVLKGTDMNIFFLKKEFWLKWALVLNSMMFLLAVMALGFLLRETNFSYYSSLFESLPLWLVKIRFTFSISLRLFMLLGAVGVVLRLAWARLVVIFYSVFTIVTIYWKHPYSTFKDIMLKLQSQGQLTEHMVENITLYAVGLMIFFCLKDIFISIISLYLLNREDLKKQFK